MPTLSPRDQADLITLRNTRMDQKRYGAAKKIDRILKDNCPHDKATIYTAPYKVNGETRDLTTCWECFCSWYEWD